MRVRFFVVFWYVFLLFFGVFFFFVSVSYAQEETDGSGNVVSDIYDGVKVCASLEGGEDVCYADLCEYEPGYLCAEDILRSAVVVVGPEKAMKVLHIIMASPRFSIQTDGHLLAHVIGRSLSDHLGSSGENFLRCPHDFNDGCYHGFFEDTLAKVDDPVAVAVSICEGMPSESTSEKEKSYCYHGAGHVFLMNESHYLDTALARCVLIPDRWVDSCVSGVFMENAWPSRDWEAKKKNFRSDDVFYPCTVVDDRFKSSCYTEHYNYLMQEHTDSFEGLLDICMQAGVYARDCIGGIVLMLQNPSWVNMLVEDFAFAGGYMDKVLFLCGRFPDEYQGVCPDYLVGALLNFDYPDMSRVVVFCEGINADYRTSCFQSAGSYLSSLGSDEMRVHACMTLPTQYRADCLHPRSGGEERVFATDWSFTEDVQEELGTSPGTLRVFFSRLFSSVIDVLVKFLLPVQEVNASTTEASRTYVSAIRDCLDLSDNRAECYALLCEYDPGYLCAEDVLNEVTKEDSMGPEVGMRILSDMVEGGIFNLTLGDAAHNLAHVVGRATAQHVGMDGEAFLRCPTTFDYGCVHGFLEIALVEVESPSSKINEVCESLPEKPEIGRPNCYHGSGHGVMMGVSYNLTEALAICDGLSDAESCWSGVFMENVNGYGRIVDLYPEHNSFDKSNPYAPCDGVDRKYRQVCYRVHMPYLSMFFQYDVQRVVDTCLNAGEHTEDCVFGFGWHALFESLQDALHPDPGMSMVEKTIYLCNQFPDQYRSICYRPAVNQITVSHGVERSFEFCEKIESRYAQECYQEVGQRLSHLITRFEERVEACSSVPEVYRSICLGSDFNRHLSAESFNGGVASDVKEGDPSFLSRVFGFFNTAVSYLVRLFAQGVFAHDGEGEVGAGQGGLIAVDQYAYPEIRSDLQRCLNLSESRGECYASLCGAVDVGYICAEHLVYEVTSLRDAAAGMSLIRDISKIQGFGVTDDSVFAQHQLAHIVGRSLARNHGITGDVFIQCPTDFDYGCWHGFFEAALQEAASPADALSNICVPSETTIENDTANCYHGGGHGLMMDAAYDLDSALFSCDNLSDPHAIGNCHGGVFMESGKGYVGGRVPEENDRYYRKDDLLAPCNSLEQKYRYACYSSHFMYYVQHVASVSVENLVALCRDAGDDFGICLSGATRLFIEGPQNTVLRASELDFQGDEIEKTIFLCNLLPEGHARPCHLFLVNYYMDDLNSRSGRLEKAVQYCGLVGEVYREDCFQTVFARLNDFVVDSASKDVFCAVVPKVYRDGCMPEGQDRQVSESDTFAVSTEFQDSFSALKHLFLSVIVYVVIFI